MTRRGGARGTVKKRKNDELSDSAESVLSGKAGLLLAVILLLTIALVGALLLASRPQPTTITILPPPTPTPVPPTATPAPLQVYVTGAVAKPGQVVTLPPDSRVEAAVLAAGGLSDKADGARINLARALRDGEHIHVPAVGEAAAAPAESSVAASKVRVNSATQAELETLPGVGPVTAERIIAYRQQHGAFAILADLDAVKGIGPASLEKLRGKVAFD